MVESPSGARPRVGLILTGGGARAAYQVGFLRAVSHMLPRGAANPFQIICGTSAGAVNAAVMAAGATEFQRTVRRLMLVWKYFHAHQVYRSDVPSVISTGIKWLAAMLLGGLGRNNPTSLLDNAPLAQLLRRHLDFAGIRNSIESGALYALSVTTSGYTSGQSVSFFQGVPGLAGWQRARRIGVPEMIDIDHLMASSALPFLFPAVPLRREFFGDGSMRQIAPISPALHLGADRVIVIGVGRQSGSATERVKTIAYPSLAQIAGHALNSIFLDSLEVDVERLQRINRTIRLISPEDRSRHDVQLREVDVLVIAPSEEIDRIAARHTRELPRAIRFLLRGLGATRTGGATLTSYLLFEPAYCRALIALGYKDTMAKREEVLRFIGTEK
ncbi:MAG TPA: patatin-like phospholipase family protein [Burkholderiales bacterium]|jgi:NTE family protein|nr:patatin-like phospholipase family protein [Burkholderiales bacterium]